jgi:hypothetical protein
MSSFTRWAAVIEIFVYAIQPVDLPLTRQQLPEPPRMRIGIYKIAS